MRLGALTGMLLCLCLAGLGQSAGRQPVANSGGSGVSQDASGITALPQSRTKLGGSESEQRITREVLHELLMLPYYTLFDDLSFRVENNNTVVLMGEVVNPVNKSDAENAVRRVEGVQNVINQIEILPPSPMDAGIRRSEYHSIFGFDGMYRYAMGAIPSIHIIVKNGRVTLFGVVDSDTDKNMAGLRAKSVSGVFSVDNQLQVSNQSGEKK